MLALFFQIIIYRPEHTGDGWIDVNLAVFRNSSESKLRLVRGPQLARENDIQVRAQLVGEDRARYDAATWYRKYQRLVELPVFHFCGELVSRVFAILEHGQTSWDLSSA